MPTPTYEGECRVEGCYRPLRVVKRQLCTMHYVRWQRTGSVGEAEALFVHGDLLTRMADKFTVGDNCWEWTAARNGGGYGVLSNKTGSMLAYKVLYELMSGPIPEGHDLHHTCENRGCVRPGHLIPLTPTQHAQAHMLLKTHCKHGHEYTPENTYIPPGRNDRNCRTCKWEREHAVNK